MDGINALLQLRNIFLLAVPNSYPSRGKVIEHGLQLVSISYRVLVFMIPKTRLRRSCSLLGTVEKIGRSSPLAHISQARKSPAGATLQRGNSDRERSA
jgi:hypothetical protein